MIQFLQNYNQNFLIGSWSHIPCNHIPNRPKSVFIPVGKGSLMFTVFWPPLSHIRMDLRLGTPPYLEIKNPRILYQIATLYGKIFPCFMFTVCLFVLLKNMHHTASGQLHDYICLPCRVNGVLQLQHKKGESRQITLHWAVKKHPLAMGDQCPVLKVILFCIFPKWLKCCPILCLSVLYFPWWYNANMK